jgi:hypothetical protein
LQNPFIVLVGVIMAPMPTSLAKSDIFVVPCRPTPLRPNCAFLLKSANEGFMARGGTIGSGIVPPRICAARGFWLNIEALRFIGMALPQWT